MEYDWAWAVRFDSKEHLETGDVMQAPLSRLPAVPTGGSPVRFAPTTLSAEESRAWFSTGTMSRRGAGG